MTKQWMRTIKLVIQLDEAGNALDLSELHIRFYVRQALVGIPGSAEIRVYNLGKETAGRLKDLTPKYNTDGTLANGVTPFTVRLQAGYPDNCDTIFEGQIRQIRPGKENATDSFVDILGQTADVAHNYAVIKQSFAAGAGNSPTSIIGQVSAAYAKYGVETGFIPQLPSTGLPRGKVIYGLARDCMDTLADSHGLNWGYDNGQLVCTTIGDPTDDEAIELNAQTGMVGLPCLTQSGVNVRSLINPGFHIGKLVKLNNDSIQVPLVDVSYGAWGNNVYVSDAAKDTDGNYKIVSVSHMGDTRGQFWYSDLITVGVNATKPITGPYINAVAGNG